MGDGCRLRLGGVVFAGAAGGGMRRLFPRTKTISQMIDQPLCRASLGFVFCSLKLFDEIGPQIVKRYGGRQNFVGRHLNRARGEPCQSRIFRQEDIALDAGEVSDPMNALIRAIQQRCHRRNPSHGHRSSDISVWSIVGALEHTVHDRVNDCNDISDSRVL